jgi:protein-tyrosine phosphatase
VQPWEASRVRLKKPIDGSDYINASSITLTSEIPDTQEANPFMNGPLQRRYIAAQGPTEGTAFHFWQMVLQHSAVIIMLTGHFEGGRERCSHYFPTDMKNPSMTVRAPMPYHGEEF